MAPLSRRASVPAGGDHLKSSQTVQSSNSVQQATPGAAAAVRKQGRRKGQKAAKKNQQAKPDSSKKTCQRSCHLFVGNVPLSATEMKVRRTLETYGTIVDFALCHGASKRFAFVKLASEEDSLAMLAAGASKEGILVDGIKLNVETRKSTREIMGGACTKFPGRQGKLKPAFKLGC
jgi:hypothetical protein